MTLHDAIPGDAARPLYHDWRVTLARATPTMRMPPSGPLRDIEAFLFLHACDANGDFVSALRFAYRAPYATLRNALSPSSRNAPGASARTARRRISSSCPRPSASACFPSRFGGATSRRAAL